MSAPQKRIAAAFVLGMVLVTGAFVLSSRVKVQQGNLKPTAHVTDRTYIPVTDADADSIPDWKDTLLAAAPIDLDQIASSTYTEPKTVTGKVAIDLFKNFLQSKTFGVFGDSEQEVVEKAVTQLKEESKDELFTRNDLTIIEHQDTAILRMYGNEVAFVFLNETYKTESVLNILEDALHYKEPEKLQELDLLIEAYNSMIQGLVAISVPESYVVEHLAVLNALVAVREDTIAMRGVFDDALYTFARTKRYQTDVVLLGQVVATLFDTLYTQDTVRWVQGESVLQLMHFGE
jgi:hypothetical protein